jgi:hypothetical protein
VAHLLPLSVSNAGEWPGEPETRKGVSKMEKKDTRTVARQIEDLPVEAEQAAEVKGGIVPDAPELSATYLSAKVIKAFNPQPDPPKTL